MGFVKKIFKYITDKNYRFTVNANLGRYDNMPDEEYIKKMFRAELGENLDLDAPRTYNEKLQWLKLYDRKDVYTTMVDKYKVRDFVAGRIGEEYLIPLLGVWKTPDEIDFSALPDRFVLKCNHNSGRGMYICKDKSALDEKAVRKGLADGLKENYYLHGREWPYKNVERRIIAEEFVEDEKLRELRDYKFYSIGGKPRVIMINGGRAEGRTTADYFDTDFNTLDFTWGYPHADALPEKPAGFEKMKELAAVLSAGVPELRVDFYEANGKIYFGELTFFDGSGFDKIEPAEWDIKLGETIVLPEKTL